MKAISEEGSFTAAAVVTGLHPARDLADGPPPRAAHGHRPRGAGGRNVRLTEAGQVLARHAAPVLAALDAAEEEVAAIAGLRSGRVRLMAFPSASATLVPRALALVEQRYPDVQVTFTGPSRPRAWPPSRPASATSPWRSRTRAPTSGAARRTSTSSSSRRCSTTRSGSRCPRTTQSPSRTRSTSPTFGRAWIAGCPRCRGHLLQLTHDAGFRPDVGLRDRGLRRGAWASSPRASGSRSSPTSSSHRAPPRRRRAPDDARLAPLDHTP